MKTSLAGEDLGPRVLTQWRRTRQALDCRGDALSHGGRRDLLHAGRIASDAGVGPLRRPRDGARKRGVPAGGGRGGRDGGERGGPLRRVQVTCTHRTLGRAVPPLSSFPYGCERIGEEG